MTRLHSRRPAGARLGRGLGGALACSILVVGLAGCDSLLDVEPNPHAVPAEELNNPTSLNARLIGAEANFFMAYDMAIAFSGLFTDVLVDGTGLDEIEQRRVTAENGLIGAADENPEGIDGLWTPMQRAAFTSNEVQTDIREGNFPDQVPSAGDSPELARMSLFAGYSKLVLGEMFCSTAFDGVGPEYSSAETYELAIEEFSEAIDAANASDEVRHAAYVGRARARLHLGRDEAALADAQQVPADYEFNAAVYSTNSQQEENDLWNMLSDSQRFSVGPDFRDLVVDDGSEADPRVVVYQDPNDRFAIDGSTPLYQAEKYSTPTAPVRLASGDEAQYIIAELEGGSTAVDIINAVRARHGIATEWSPSSGTEEEILRKILDERGRTLFLEGQRMSDMRRYLDRYGIDAFPTGDGFGDRTCFPLPDAERDTNPDI